MKISIEKLTVQAEATGFRPDVLEKVATCWDCSNLLAVIPS